MKVGGIFLMMHQLFRHHAVILLLGLGLGPLALMMVAVVLLFEGVIDVDVVGIIICVDGN